MHVGPIEEVNLCAVGIGLVKMVWQQLSSRMCWTWPSGIAAAIGRTNSQKSKLETASGKN